MRPLYQALLNCKSISLSGFGAIEAMEAIPQPAISPADWAEFCKLTMSTTAAPTTTTTAAPTQKRVDQKKCSLHMNEVIDNVTDERWLSPQRLNESITKWQDWAFGHIQ